jgi:hypothetical protein
MHATSRSIPIPYLRLSHVTQLEDFVCTSCAMRAAYFAHLILPETPKTARSEAVVPLYLCDQCPFWSRLCCGMCRPPCVQHSVATCLHPNCGWVLKMTHGVPYYSLIRVSDCIHEEVSGSARTRRRKKYRLNLLNLGCQFLPYTPLWTVRGDPNLLQAGEAAGKSFPLLL